MKAVPVNNLKEAGIDLFSLAQKTPDFFDWYKAGSIIRGLALWYLQASIQYVSHTISIERNYNPHIYRDKIKQEWHAHSFHPKLLVCSRKFRSLGKYEKICKRSRTTKYIEMLANPIRLQTRTTYMPRIWSSCHSKLIFLV